MKQSVRKKLGFIGTIFLSMLTVVTGSVTTFAWFQAQANVNVQASSSSTTITVNKPNEYTFYAYNGNGDSNYIPENNGNTFDNDFTPLTTSALVNTHTNFNAMVPGDVYAFAIKVPGSSHVLFSLDKVISNNATKQGLNKAIPGSSLAANAPGVNGVTYYTRAASGAGAGYLNDGTYQYTKVTGAIPATHNANVYWTLTQLGGERYVYNTDYHKINVGYAMNLYLNTYKTSRNSLPTGYSYFVKSDEGKTSSGGSAGTDNFNYAVGEPAHRTLLDSGTQANPEITVNTTLFDDDLDSSKDFFIIWTVVYSETSDVLYDEVSYGNPTVLDEPAEGDRFFKQSNTGTSNCFGGLDFALTKFTLNI